MYLLLLVKEGEERGRECWRDLTKAGESITNSSKCENDFF